MYNGCQLGAGALSESEHIQTQFDENTRILTVTLNRRDNSKNQIHRDIVFELEDILKTQLLEPTLHGLILNSAHEKVFSTGADIEGVLSKLSATDATRFSRQGRAVFGFITQLPCPSVAAISGFALGGGLELALCCDFRIAAKNVRLGVPEINLGVLPGWGGTQRLPRLIGRSRALRMILSGDPVNAATALEWGLVDEVVDGYEDLHPAAVKLLGRFNNKSLRALEIARRAVNEGLSLPLPAALDLESELFGLAWSTPDREEGISAFMEKRRPKWPE